MPATVDLVERSGDLKRELLKFARGQRFARTLRFSWERDGEALLRRYKASYFDQPVLPSVTPLSDRLSRAQIAEKAGGLAAGHRPGRDEPCPCGSGRKYKHCCGR